MDIYGNVQQAQPSTSFATISSCNAIFLEHFPEQSYEKKIFTGNLLLMRFISFFPWQTFSLKTKPIDDELWLFHVEHTHRHTNTYTYTQHSVGKKCGIRKSHGGRRKRWHFRNSSFHWKTSNSINFQISKLANDIVFSLFHIIALRSKLYSCSC